MFERFVYWLSEVTPEPLFDTPYDLIVLETGVTSVYGPVMSGEALSLIQSNGTTGIADDRTVLGYVNVAITDHRRDWWQQVWVDAPDVEGNGDVGTPTALAPDWLATPLGEARGPVAEFDVPAPDNPEETIYGPIVDFVRDDPDMPWRDLVIDQAVAVIEAGYDGVFLDDVGRYYIDEGVNAGTTLGERAEAMQALVIAVADAVRAVDEDAFVAINSGAYLIWDNGDDGDSQLDQAFLASVDALLMENLSNENRSTWEDAVTFFLPGTTFLSVEWADTLMDPEGYAAWATELGILTHVPDDAGYDEYTPIASDPAPGPGAINGTDASEEIFGTEGDDLIFAGAGDDTIHGLGGNDTIIGGAGDDVILAGAGNDSVEGGDGGDTIFAQGGADTLKGGEGDDLLSGGSPADDFLF